MTLSQDLLTTHSRMWADLVGHDFFRLIEEQKLPQTARDVYFLYERVFVDEAVVVFAHILSKATRLEGRRHLVSVLRGLVHDQVDLFDILLARCGLPVEPVARAECPAAVQRLCDGMTELARDGTYGDGLAAMFAAERSYLEVSRRIMAAGVGDAELDAWFRLHTEPPFTEGVAWLGREIDRLGAAGATVFQLAPAFRRATALECDFHAAALDAAPGVTLR